MYYAKTIFKMPKVQGTGNNTTIPSESHNENVCVKRRSFLYAGCHEFTNFFASNRLLILYSLFGWCLSFFKSKRNIILQNIGLSQYCNRCHNQWIMDDEIVPLLKLYLHLHLHICHGNLRQKVWWISFVRDCQPEPWGDGCNLEHRTFCHYSCSDCFHIFNGKQNCVC